MVLAVAALGVRRGGEWGPGPSGASVADEVGLEGR